MLNFLSLNPKNEGNMSLKALRRPLIHPSSYLIMRLVQLSAKTKRLKQIN
ncbi:hypothetical protein V6Z12_A04G159800 [Gossypium hirsutum]